MQCHRSVDLSPKSPSTVVCVVAGILLLVIGQRAGAQKVSDVIEGWKKREDLIRSLRCEWDQRIAIRPLPGLFSLDGKKESKSARADLRVGQQSWLLILDNRRIRTESSGLKWDSIGDTFDNWRTTYIFKESTNLWHRAFKSKKAPWPGSSSGIVNKHEPFSRRRNFYILPILVNTRPMCSVLSHIDPTRLQGAHRPTVVDGVECWAVHQRIRNSTAGKWTYWIAPQKDFGVVRVTCTNSDGIVTGRWDIALAREGNSPICMPLSWKAKTFLVSVAGDELSVREAVDATVDTSKVNVEVKERVFDFEFPAGTHVSVSDGQNHLAYLVKKGGEKEVLREWRTATAPAGVPPEETSTSFRLWITFATLFLGFVAVVLLAWRQVYKRVKRREGRGVR